MRFILLICCLLRREDYYRQRMYYRLLHSGTLPEGFVEAFSTPHGTARFSCVFLWVDSILQMLCFGQILFILHIFLIPVKILDLWLCRENISWSQ